MLDRIIELEQGISATALSGISADRYFSQVLMVECVAQLSGIVVAQEEGEGGFLAAIDHADFFGVPAAGAVLTISATVIKSFGRLFLIKGAVASGQKQLLSVQLTLGVGRL